RDLEKIIAQCGAELLDVNLEAVLRDAGRIPKQYRLRPRGDARRYPSIHLIHARSTWREPRKHDITSLASKAHKTRRRGRVERTHGSCLAGREARGDRSKAASIECHDRTRCDRIVR